MDRPLSEANDGMELSTINKKNESQGETKGETKDEPKGEMELVPFKKLKEGDDYYVKLSHPHDARDTMSDYAIVTNFLGLTTLQDVKDEDNDDGDDHMKFLRQLTMLLGPRGAGNYLSGHGDDKNIEIAQFEGIKKINNKKDHCNLCDKGGRRSYFKDTNGRLNFFDKGEFPGGFEFYPKTSTELIAKHLFNSKRNKKSIYKQFPWSVKDDPKSGNPHAGPGGINMDFLHENFHRFGGRKRRTRRRKIKRRNRKTKKRKTRRRKTRKHKKKKTKRRKKGGGTLFTQTTNFRRRFPQLGKKIKEILDKQKDLNGRLHDIEHFYLPEIAKNETAIGGLAQREGYLRSYINFHHMEPDIQGEPYAGHETPMDKWAKHIDSHQGEDRADVHDYMQGGRKRKTRRKKRKRRKKRTRKR